MLGAHLVALLLALNRYVSIVDIRYYNFLFTKCKIRLYFLIIVCFNVSVNAIFSLVTYALEKTLRDETSPDKRHDFLVFHRFVLISHFIKTLFSILVISVIVFIYQRIYNFKPSDISFKEKMNKMTIKIKIKDGESAPLRVHNLFQDSVEINKLYLKSVNISIFITAALFVFHAILEWSLLVFQLRSQQTCHQNNNSTDCIIDYSNIYIDPLIFPAVVNPIVFLLNNADFRNKLKRPIRALGNTFFH